MAFVIDELLSRRRRDLEFTSFVHVAMELFVADAVFDVEFFRNARSGIAEGLIAGLNGKLVVLDGGSDR